MLTNIQSSTHADASGQTRHGHRNGNWHGNWHGHQILPRAAGRAAYPLMTASKSPAYCSR